jgi:hypothetical protein
MDDATAGQPLMNSYLEPINGTETTMRPASTWALFILFLQTTMYLRVAHPLS